MPSPLSSAISWVSFMSFLALRRKSFVRFLEDNQSELVFDKRYIDLFFNELVRRFIVGMGGTFVTDGVML